MSSRMASTVEAYNKQSVVKYIRTIFAKSERHLATLISIFAIVLSFAFFFFNFIIPQTPGRMAKASSSLIQDLPLWSSIVSFTFPSLKNSNQVAFLIILFSTLAFVVYGLAVFVTWKRESNLKNILFVIFSGIFFFLISVWALPNVNTDIFDYITHGRVAAVYDSNPYYVAPDKFPDDPIYPYSSHRYGILPTDKYPAWVSLNIFVASIAGNDPVTNLLCYRFTFFLLNTFNLILIGLILLRLYPKYLLGGLVAYTWNPIVVIFGQSKTDTLMVFFLLLSIYLLINNKKNLAIVSMGLSTLVKPITGPLVGVFWLREVKLKKWRGLLITSFLLGATIIAVYIPFWDGPSIITNHLNRLEAGPSASGLFRMVLQIVFAGLILWIGLIQDGKIGKLLSGWSIIGLFFAIFLTSIGFSWYLMVPIALVSLIKDWRLLALTIFLSFTSFVFNSWYSTFIKDFKVDEIFQVNRFVIYLALPMVIFLSLMAVAGYKKFLQHQ